MAGTRSVLALALATLAACGGGPVTEAARTLSEAHRAALADTIRALSDSIIEAGEHRDAAALTARFAEGPEVAFGSAGGLVLSASQMRRNAAAGYSALRSQSLETIEQRVAILGPDAAVTTGWGNYTATDTLGAQARGTQAFTFAWARRAEGWRVIQAHFSTQLVSIRPPPGARQPAPADSARKAR